jgi:hypothetical protein
MRPSKWAFAPLAPWFAASARAFDLYVALIFPELLLPVDDKHFLSVKNLYWSSAALVAILAVVMVAMPVDQLV